MTEIIYLLEVTVYDPALPGEKVLRYCTGAGYVYAGNYYEPRIKHPGRLKRMLYSEDATQSPTTRGPSSVGFGEVILTNPDGALDALLTYGFDGRTLMIKKALAIGAVLSGIVLLAACSMEQPTTTWDEVAIRIKDRQQELNVPLQPLKYGGSNVLPAGIDGTADIAGKPQPLAFGVVKNVTPVCVNTSRLIYQLHAGALAEISSVYDKGVELVAGAAYADQADLEANAPAAGEYRTWLAGGCFRLGSAPSGLVTADATEGASAADRSAARLIERIAVQAPTIAAGDITAADITALHTANPAEVGYYASAETTVAGALDAVAGSIGAWYGFDAAGLLRCGRLEAPTGEPVAVITDPLSIERIPTGDEGRGLPVWNVTLGYDRNWSENIGLAGSSEFLDKRLWKQEVVPAGGWMSSAYGNGIFLVKDGTTGTTLMRSYNSRDWETFTTPGEAPDNDFLTVSFANGWFFLVGDFHIYRSTDTVTWETITFTNSIPGNNEPKVVFGNGKFVLRASTEGYTSVDGETWTRHTGLPAATGSTLIFGADFFFVTSGVNGYKSTDGEAWTLVTLPTTSPATTNWHLSAFGNGAFVLATGEGHAAFSENLVDWGTLPLSSTYANKFIFSEGLFCLCFNNRTISAFSTDGREWAYTNRALPSSGGTLVAGNGVFCFLNGIANPDTLTVMSKFHVSMGSEEVSWYANKYRTVTAPDSTVKTVHLLARGVNVDTLIVDVDAAQAEADRLLALYSVDRDCLRVKVPRDQVPADVLGKILQLQVPRYGYNAGKLFVVIGAEEDHETGNIILVIWG